jgi:hypothetical protein
MSSGSARISVSSWPLCLKPKLAKHTNQQDLALLQCKSELTMII